MKSRNPEVSSGLAGPAGPSGPEGPAAEAQQASEDRAVGRRALLRRGGVVVAGLAGAGLAGAAAAAPAGAATTDPVLQGEVNNVGTGVPATEITASNAPSTTATPTVIATNTGVSTAGEAGPSLRLTPSTTGSVPANATVGGDLVATSDGNLWFTHPIPGFGPFAAPVHTDANSNSFVPPPAPKRMLDTRSASGRVNILDPSGNLDSSGRLLSGKTIHINLTSLVSFGDAVTATLTAIGPTGTGYLILWSGAVARPTAVSVNFISGQSISNLTVAALAQFSQTATDTIAIYTTKTTHVLLDVAGFTVADIGQVNPTFTAATMTGTTRARRAKQGLAQLRSQHR